ncbi:MAG TPA: glycoside hydrolase family 16 protein [Cytophagales bacterium]|nr:glycoside hydrolase family 16 protein [Cytophagales bacterium]
MNRINLISLVLIFIFLLGCKKDDTENPVKPSDLVIEATVSNDGSGLVSFSALAKNAAYYNYYFGVSATEAPVKSTDGNASFTYTTSGDFTVKVVAVSSSNEFVTGTKVINVQLPEVAPANLIIEATVSTDGSGKVTFNASADNAKYYNFYFGTSATETPTKSTNGQTSYTYSSSGTYTVKVDAYATTKFVSGTKEITVEVIENTGYTTPETYAGMNLVWRDEFEGTSLSATDWTFETGTGSGGWGNNELQYYKEENTSVADGFLTITAKKESFGGKDYTSSRIITKDKQSFKYGRIDIRAKLPKGQGLWPALWMLGSNFNSVGWPKCGEIDIMEMVGGTGKDNTVHGTLHWYEDSAVPHASYGGNMPLNTGVFADEFHVFTITWDETNIKWFIDDQQYLVINITPDGLSEFHEEFFFIFNVAVGGNWPGSPNASTVFPQTMVVDYVRVFQDN